MKLKILISFLFISLAASPLMAHDFWAKTEGPAADGKLTVAIGYGHNFPEGEKLKAEDVSERYQPPKLFSPKGEVKLVPESEPGVFVTESPLTKDTYLITVDSKTSFSSQTPNGWVRKSKKEDPSATRCTFGANFGKSIVNIDVATNKEAAAKVVGQKLEIVPLINPYEVRVGQPFPVKVLFDQKPLARVSLGAYFAGFSEDNSAYAFSAYTNKDGEVSIIPLMPGQWLAKVVKSDPYSDPAVCDNENYTASFTFTVKE
ncbi:MAG: DUF4198 domain-containing protein [Deltaproteobacteria bacterium]|jgi:uncharacterized GH25 family protein|nr:DUF4198 domain-containing protein [Deltaproteobacteria bacterium]